MLTLILKAFGNNMFDIPLLITRPEVKEVAESVAKRTGQETSPAHVMYDYLHSFLAIAKSTLTLFKPRLVSGRWTQCHPQVRYALSHP
jgi:hypothetical protein